MLTAESSMIVPVTLVSSQRYRIKPGKQEFGRGGSRLRMLLGASGPSPPPANEIDVAAAHVMRWYSSTCVASEFRRSALRLIISMSRAS
jgi:hypothetical protein